MKPTIGASLLLLTAAGFVSACSGAGFAAPTYTIDGTLSGLSGTGLVLVDNGSDYLTPSEYGAFSLAGSVPSGIRYAVTVKTQPSNPSQTCTLANETGNVASSDVTGIAVSCVDDFVVGGVVSGLSGTGLVSGQLTTMAGKPHATGYLPSALLFDPSGKFAYSGTQNCGTPGRANIRLYRERRERCPDSRVRQSVRKCGGSGFDRSLKVVSLNET